VCLVSATLHLGGMLSGGIGVLDTLYEGKRAPILDEFVARIADHYHEPKPRASGTSFEPHVAEQIVDSLVAAEKSITVIKGYAPVRVERHERTIQSVMFAAAYGRDPRRIAGRIFIDATYEGDLAELAGVPCRIGRESRQEYGEPHAGKVFTRRSMGGKHPRAAANGELRLRPFPAIAEELLTGSTGEGDDQVQAYHYRLCLTNEPARRRPVTKPAGYDAARFRKLFGPEYDFKRVSGRPLHNGKTHWFQNFTGGSTGYPGGSRRERARIEAQHRDFALGILYFLQNDPDLAAGIRNEFAPWGLAKDEFTDNDNIPYQLHVREGRRIMGRYVFTQQDAMLAPGLQCAPIHRDSIAFTEWPMDSHEVSAERRQGSDFEGKLILSELTRPAHVPFRTLLPKEIDNLLVPVCLSATHVGWGAIRLEPTWMHIGESVGFACALALRKRIAPADIPVPELQRTLVKNNVWISFLNDMDAASASGCLPAAQYLAARGFFGSYNIRPRDLLSQAVAEVWARGCADSADPNAIAREALTAESTHGEVLPVAKTRAEALRIIYDAQKS
jgi:hypothetical protein